MLQRVGIAQALLNDPEVIFLDEPMSGLDPLGRRDVRALILELRDQGRTVFFSSHILADAEALCRRVAVVAGGRLAASGRCRPAGVSAPRLGDGRGRRDAARCCARIAPARARGSPRFRPGRYMFEVAAGSATRAAAAGAHRRRRVARFNQPGAGYARGFLRPARRGRVRRAEPPRRTHARN